jgi:hypothetical protein
MQREAAIGIVRLGADGSVEVLEPSTTEEAERAWEGLPNVARALGRLAAARDFEAQRNGKIDEQLTGDSEL